MFDRIFKLFIWFFGIWGGMPQERRDKIIETIVESFDRSLRNYFKASKTEDQNNAI
jgi:hypothetical protein